MRTPRQRSVRRKRASRPRRIKQVLLNRLKKQPRARPVKPKLLMIRLALSRKTCKRRQIKLKQTNQLLKGQLAKPSWTMCKLTTGQMLPVSKLKAQRLRQLTKPARPHKLKKRRKRLKMI